MPDLSQSSSNPPVAAGKTPRGTGGDFQQSLIQYAAAAVGIASLTAVATAQSTSRHILYTAANISLTEPNGTPIPIDFNHDGITDITISASGFAGQFSSHVFGASGSMNEIPAAGNTAIGAALPKGEIIDRGGTFQGTKQQMAWAFYEVAPISSFHKTSSGGPFKDVTNRYLGVRFLIRGQVHEGWIRISANCNHGVVSGTISGYAYDVVPNEFGLAAGQLGGRVGAAKTPIEQATPGSLGVLALGHLAANSD